MVLRATLLASSAFVAIAAPAAAQSVDTNVDELVVTGAYTIDERIDTATGLGLTLRETPQSVTVVTAQRILDQNLGTVADVVENTVGVSVSEIDDVRNTFNARGFEINNYQVDGVPLAWNLAGSAGETMADVSIYDRVEVVRGATGLLTGAGDPSASINLVRKHATSREFTGYASVSGGSWNTWQAAADLAGPLFANGAVRGRAVAKYEQGDSFVDLLEDQKYVLYGVIDADIDDNTLLRVGASHQQENPTAPAWGALPAFFDDGSFTAFPRSQSTSANWAYWDTLNQNVFANVTRTFANGWSVKANYNWLRNAEKTKILYISGVVDRATGGGLSGYPFSDNGESVQNSIDVQVNGGYGLFGREHQLVLGAIASTQTITTSSFDASAFPTPGSLYTWDGSYPNPGFSPTGVLQVDMTTKQTGVYGSTRLNVTDSLKVILGGRLSSWSREGVNYNILAPFDFGDDNVFIPYAGVLYDLTPSHRLYASYTEIFQPQNAQDRNGAYLDPITGKAAELGLKSAFFNERLQTSIAVFQIVQDNLAQPDIGFFVPGLTPPAQAQRAAEGTTSEGFELEVIGEPLPDWKVSFGYSQFEAEDADDQKINTDFPRQTLKVFTTYRLPGALSGLTLGGGVNWQSKSYSVAVNPVTGASVRLQQDAYALLNLMARYQINDALSLQANLDNATDETYYSQVGFFDQYRYGQPRNVTVSLKYDF